MTWVRGQYSFSHLRLTPNVSASVGWDSIRSHPEEPWIWRTSLNDSGHTKTEEEARLAAEESLKSKLQKALKALGVS